MVSTVDIMFKWHFYSLGKSKVEGTASLYVQIKEWLSIWCDTNRSDNETENWILSSIMRGDRNTTCALVEILLSVHISYKDWLDRLSLDL